MSLEVQVTSSKMKFIAFRDIPEHNFRFVYLNSIKHKNEDGMELQTKGTNLLQHWM